MTGIDDKLHQELSKKAWKIWHGDMVRCFTQSGGAGFEDAALIPNHSIKGRASFPIMIINFNTRDSCHELVEINHNGVPVIPCAKEGTSGTDNSITMSKPP